MAESVMNELQNIGHTTIATAFTALGIHWSGFRDTIKIVIALLILNQRMTVYIDSLVFCCPVG